MNGGSPSPRDLSLSAIQQSNRQPRPGKLTIFLGMCAGVGKTYAMLETAQERKANGIDVVLAVVATHERAETEALLGGLPLIPLRPIEYRGVISREMDLDAVLRRRPRLVLVDELAHTNAPGTRHPQRYQDVLELLDAGVDVYTTLNVQHLESRVDVVRQVTGVAVQETVPDSILDLADTLQLADLTPEELCERLAQGKVYLGEMAPPASAHFFREESLTALREMALRITAEHVNRDLRDAMAARQIAGPWKTNVTLMVAVGPSPFSEALIRWTRGSAAARGARWLAVYVEPPGPVSEEDKKRLVKALSTARHLGAHVITTAGDDLVGALLRIAREENVTQIVVGKPFGTPLCEFLRGGSLVDRLIRRSGDIDITAVRTEVHRRRPRAPGGNGTVVRSWILETVLGLLSVAALTGVCWLLKELTGYWSIALVYLALVVFLDTQVRRGIILLIAAVSALLWNFLFIPPLFTLRIGHLQDALMFIMYFVVALVISQLTGRLRFREMAERKREQRTAAMYRLTQGVVESTTLDDGLRRAAQEIRNAFTAQSAVLLVGENRLLNAQAEPAGTWPLNDKDNSLAAWVLAHGQPAGRYTGTLPEADSLYVPLQTTKNQVGVLIVHFDQRQALVLDERELLETFADQIAVMIERYWLIQEAGRAQVAEESEKLYKTLFDCVSHELKTPLAVIQASADKARQILSLVKDSQGAPGFLQEIETASDRLSRIVDNLLNMTRIESGRYTLAPVWSDADEIIASARQQAGDLLAKHRFRVIVADDMPSIKTDSAFVEQALANLLANAAGYSPEGSQITVSARLDGHHLVLRVMDEGPGLSPEVARRVFEKFYRGPNAPPGGVGLGLSIVRGLMQALKGEVTTENNPERGTAFTLRIPVEIGKIPESS